MFEFFKDSFAELQGLDSNAMKKERLQKEIAKKENKILLSNSTKNTIRIIAGLYFLIAIIAIFIPFGGANEFRIFKLIVLLIMAVVIFVLTLFKNKKTEIASLIGVAVFVLINGFIK